MSTVVEPQHQDRDAGYRKPCYATANQDRPRDHWIKLGAGRAFLGRIARTVIKDEKRGQGR